MHIRDATPSDIEVIQRVARESLLESYGSILDEETINEAVDQWFDGERLGELLADEDRVLFPVVEIGEEVIAFAQCHLVDSAERIGEIHWLHVGPDHRGKGIGQDLLDYVVSQFEEFGIHRLKGLVFEENREGCLFYERNDFELGYTHQQTVAGRTYTENVYIKIPATETWRRELEPFLTADGEELYIAYHEASIGTNGPFHVAYLDQDRERRYGWFCSACESFETNMDPMGRVVCANCGNRRKATRWDAAYL